MHVIATAELNAPKPFTANPFTVLVLASQMGTTERYVQVHDADADMDMLEAEAKALELQGDISEADLAANWKIDAEYAAAEAAQAAGDIEDTLFEEEGAPLEIEEEVQEVEPIA